MREWNGGEIKQTALASAIEVCNMKLEGKEGQLALSRNNSGSGQNYGGANTITPLR